MVLELRRRLILFTPELLQRIFSHDTETLLGA